MQNTVLRPVTHVNDLCYGQFTLGKMLDRWTLTAFESSIRFHKTQ